MARHSHHPPSERDPRDGEKPDKSAISRKNEKDAARVESAKDDAESTPETDRSSEAGPDTQDERAASDDWYREPPTKPDRPDKPFTTVGKDPADPVFPHPTSTIISATGKEPVITEAPERTGIRISTSLIAETEGGEAALSDRPTLFRPSSGRLVQLDPDGAVEYEPQAVSALEDRVEMLSIVGRGGMGSIHAARDRQLLRTVAVKILNRALVSEESIVRRFLSEAQVLAQLEHPNIVPFYTLERTADGTHAFLMRLVEGKTFTQYLQQCASHAETGETSTGPHSMQTRIEHLLKVCDAIDYSHSRGVIHRDIKPDNLMLGAHNEVYVMDWGIALVMGAPDEAMQPLDPKAPASSAPHSTPSVRETEMNQAVGTLSYMPPEQAAGRLEDPHPTTDVYALGMVLQEMMTLRPARTSKEPAGLMMAARAGFREPIEHRFGAKLPRALKAIIETATSPTRRNRYQTVSDFADDLRRLSRNEEVSVLRDPWTTRLWRSLSKHPVAMLSTILAIVLAASAWAIISGIETNDAQARLLTAKVKSLKDSDLKSELTSEVAHHSQTLSAEFSRLSSLIDELSSAAGVMLDRPAGAGGLLLSLDDLHLAPNVVEADGYHERVSFSAASYILGPTIKYVDVAGDLKKLTPLQPFLRTLFLQSGPKEMLTSSHAEQNKMLAHGVAELHWLFVALEDGFLVTFPASGHYPSDYDPLQRSWYKSAIKSNATVWGAPYPDALTGTILLPVHRVITSPRGSVIGVAGADVTLDDFLNYLEVPKVKGWERSVVLEENGRILLDSDEVGTKTSPGLHKNLPLHLHKFDIPAVNEAIKAKDAGGNVTVGDQLVVYNRLDAQGWYFVVFVNAKELGL